MELTSINSVLQADKWIRFDSGQGLLLSQKKQTDLQHARWLLELRAVPPGSYGIYRIRHAKLPDYYFQVKSGNLHCGPFPKEEAWADPFSTGENWATWELEPLNTHATFRLRNLGYPGIYAYQIDGILGIGNIDPEFPEAHWHLEAVVPSTLLVPVHLDALWLPYDQAVLESMADFTRLPYFDGGRDVHPNTANISEHVLTPALSTPQFYLQSGLHFHWALPDAFHRGLPSDDGLYFFKAPDRWLISRTLNEVVSQWVVESNYLHPPGTSRPAAAVSFPYQDASHPQPFRYLGRQVPLAEWTERDARGDHPEYLHSLTAMGYGEPTFAAFYPNCYSVFGFYDEDSRGMAYEAVKGAQYEVIGWHSSSTADVLQEDHFIHKTGEIAGGHQAVLTTAPYQFEALKSALGWIVEERPAAAFPQAVAYFARLTLAADTLEAAKKIGSEVVIAIGNTATEALSAHLARIVFDDQQVDVLEDQIEALHLFSQMEGQQLDIGPSFQEERHRQGFRAVHGGFIASIRPTAQAHGEADAQGVPEAAAVILPGHLTVDLSALNELYRLQQSKTDQLQSLQEQLFAEWYKYMLAAYPPEDSQDDYPDMDQIAFYIRENTLRQIVALNKDIDLIKLHLQKAKSRFSEELIGLQRILTEDICDWKRLLAVLGGREFPFDERFRAIPGRISSALNPVLHDWIQRQQETGQSITEKEKVVLIDGLNEAIAEDPGSFLPTALTVLLPAEAQALHTRGKDQLALSEKQRLGRLILETVLPRTLNRRPPYVVQEIPDERFWEPAEPVVLIADTDLRLTDRHGEDGRLREDGLLDCFLLVREPEDLPETPAIDQQIAALRTRIDEIQAGLPPGEDHIGFYRWTKQVWHPFMLDWAVELFPLKEGESHSGEEPYYRNDFIQTHYDFAEAEPDLQAKDPTAPISRGANVYSGRSLLLDYAQPLLVERLEEYCIKKIAPLFYDAKKIPASQRQNKPPLEEITKWANENKAALSPFNRAVLAIQEHLGQQKTPPFAQALSGFNAALLQHKETLQLPIEDPLGFPPGKELANLVRAGVDRFNRRAPQPQNDFNPLRTGALRLQQLRLVDTFGRTQTLLDHETSPTLVAAESFRKIDPRTLLLPPRVVQPLRLNFRCLAADLTAGDTSPICGWIIPNYLENNLLTYDRQGRLLGYIQPFEEGLVWWSAPGGEQQQLEADILNEHLYQLVRYLVSQNEAFLQDLLTGIESAFENILPDYLANQDTLALLVGRPLAIVRATCDLEIKGLAATDQDWNAFRDTLQFYRSASGDFGGVHFPLRIGEHARLSDGLLGFWIENPDGEGHVMPFRDNKLYLPQTPDNANTSSIVHPDIIRHSTTTNPHILQSLDSPGLYLTMLMDPRSAVHISSGILPVQELRIPPDDYLPALSKLEMTFFSGPVISRANGVELPLASLPGYQWSLLTKENGVWADNHAIRPVEENATFSTAHVIREGWLKLERETQVDDDIDKPK